MIKNFTSAQREQFSEILDELGNTLDISESQFNLAVQSYQAVGNWLSNEDTVLSTYKPIILPQGSFLLGTMIKPINEQDDIDIDLVCQLTGKKIDWTQKDLKDVVGNRLKQHDTYNKMLEKPDGRRCWTLHYADSTNYHMDILPSLKSEGYALIEKSFSDLERKKYDELAIRITDKLIEGYDTSTNPEDWLKSNPFGYGKWFFQRASVQTIKSFSLTEAVKPVPKYQKTKLPLQRVVQILKRHRDIMFSGDENKPISIIITTLAARAYNKEVDIITALTNIANSLLNSIEDRWDSDLNRYVKWVVNPVNEEENFADKWSETPLKQKNFYSWVKQLQIDLQAILKNAGAGLHLIQESMSSTFGERLVVKAFSAYGETLRHRRESGKQFIEKGTGTIATAGTVIKNHNFFGGEK